MPDAVNRMRRSLVWRVRTGEYIFLGLCATISLIILRNLNAITMRIRLSRVMLVSTAASIAGVALVVNAASVLLDGHWDTALMRAGLGLYSCIWAFIPYDEFLRVARMPLRLGDSGEQNAYATLVPARLGLLTFLAMILMITGLVHNIIGAFR